MITIQQKHRRSLLAQIEDIEYYLTTLKPHENQQHDLATEKLNEVKQTLKTYL